MGKLMIIDCGLSVLSFSIRTIISSSFLCVCHKYGDRGGTVVMVLHYKLEGCWFDSRWCHWNFSLT
jgi:hypothetical protein